MINHIQPHVVLGQGVDGHPGSKGDTGDSGKSVSCWVMHRVNLPRRKDCRD